jgi:hypothetical protein
MAACMVFSIGSAPPANAQGFGLGPDPFQPYNQQFSPYVYPTGPATPDGGQSLPSIARMGNSSANRFGAWMNELHGASRSRSERYGIGMPYYRSSVDPLFEKLRDRDYQPNRATARSFEESQRLLTDKYLAYFSERDPRKRSALMREYNVARRQATRALGARRESPSHFVDSVNRIRRPGSEPEPGAASSAPGRTRPGATARTAPPPLDSDSPSATLRRGGSSRLGQPPDLAPGFSARPRSGARSSPSEILNRARRLERERGGSSLLNSRTRSTDRLKTRTPQSSADSDLDD